MALCLQQRGQRLQAAQHGGAGPSVERWRRHIAPGSAAPQGPRSLPAHSAFGGSSRSSATNRLRQLARVPFMPSRRDMAQSLTQCQQPTHLVAAAAAAGEAETAAAAVTPLYAGKKAVVVGAGPAGATAAMFLARQGFSVDVYERRPQPKDDPVDTGRAYIIILIPRGQAALQDLGVPLPTQQEFVTKGTVRHNRKGQVSVTKEEGNVTFSRAGLAQYLIDAARAAYPGAIAFHFGAQCEAVDAAARRATFALQPSGSAAGSGGGGSSANSSGSSGSSSSSSASGGSVTVAYDLLVGADGVQSAVRSTLQSLYPDMSVEVTDSGREYKTYTGLRGNIEPPEFGGSPGATLHLYTSDDPWTTVTAHSNPDGTYSGTMSLKTGGFANVSSEADYVDLLASKFTGLPEAWVPAIAAQTAKQTPNPAGKRIKCSRLDGPGILILGDASSAVTPVFGQGANSALESCKVLGEVLAQAGGDVDAVPGAFTAARLEDVHALNELDRKAYSFFRRKGLLDTDFLQLLSHVLLGSVLSKLLPFLYGAKPALLSLGSTIRYSAITRAVRRDSLLSALLFAALGLWLSAKLAVRFAGM